MIKGVIILPHLSISWIEVASGIDVRIDGYKVMGLQSSAMRLPIICVFIVCKHIMVIPRLPIIYSSGSSDDHCKGLRHVLQDIKPTARFGIRQVNQQHVYGMSGEIMVCNRWMNDESNWWALCRRHPIVWLLRRISSPFSRESEYAREFASLQRLSIPHPALGFSRSFDRFWWPCSLKSNEEERLKDMAAYGNDGGFLGIGMDGKWMALYQCWYNMTFLMVGSGRTTYLRAS